MHQTNTISPVQWGALGCAAVLLALLFFRMSAGPANWAFVVDNVVEPAQSATEFRTSTVSAIDNVDFVHSASLLATDKDVSAYWYTARYEGAINARIMSSRYDGTNWSSPEVVTSSNDVSREIGLTIKSIANPVAFRYGQQEIWLFFAVSRLAGWATSEPVLKRSFDNGRTWGPAQRLYASPLANMSHLTKSPPVRMADGRIGLPVYYELVNKYPVFLLIDHDGRVVDRRRIGDGEEFGLQPSIVVTSPTSAVALIRRDRYDSDQQILFSRTADGGQTWSPLSYTNLPNPGGAVSAVRYGDDHLLIAFNDDHQIERDISLAISDLDGTAWRRVGVLVNKDATITSLDRVAYPYLLQTRPGEFDLVYSHMSDKSIHHVRFSNTWIEDHLKRQAATK